MMGAKLLLILAFALFLAGFLMAVASGFAMDPVPAVAGLVLIGAGFVAAAATFRPLAFLAGLALPLWLGIILPGIAGLV